MSKPKSQSEEAILHALKIMKSNFDYIVFPQVTSPIRPKNIFDKSLKFYFKQGFDSLFSANIPPKIFFWKKNKKKITPQYNIDKRPMRQDIKDIFLENGSFYIFEKRGFMKNRNRLFGKIGAYLIDKKFSYDIDEEVDFKINELVKKNLN